MERLGLSGYGYFANVDGRKMEFVNEYELDEYVEEPSEESESSLYFRKNDTPSNRITKRRCKMDAREELKRKKTLLQSTIRRFMESTDFEEGRQLSNKIKELATEIVNLRKEIAGKEGVRKSTRNRNKHGRA